MPGLFGLININPGARLDKGMADSVLDSMSRALSHRSDYSLNSAISEKYGYALGRLSNPFGDRLPWPDEHKIGTGRNTVFLHGTFTKDPSFSLSSNRLDALPSSAPVILRDLEGFYSLVFVCPESGNVILSVDRKASEPMFYMEQNGVLMFAPEVKALLAVYRGTPELNHDAVPMLLASGHLLGDQTLLSSIKRLSGGQSLFVQSGHVERRTYWEFRPGGEVCRASDEELQAELVDLLKEAVKKNLGDPEKTMIFLSGGLDSRGILAGALLALGNHGEKLNTVSWGITDDIPGSDAMIARQIAEQFQLRHQFSPRKGDTYGEVFAETNFLTDGLTDVAAFHPYEYTIMKAIREWGFERVLRGDETFGWHGRVFNFKEAKTEVGLRSIRNITIYSNIVRPKYFHEWAGRSDANMTHLDSEVEGMDPTDAKDYLYFSHRLQGYLFSIATYKQVLFDHRNVWLDDAILEFLLRIPWRLRLHKNLYEKAVRAMCPPLSAIPLADCSGLEDWEAELKKESALQAYMRRQLDDHKSGVWEYFDREAVCHAFHECLVDSQLKALSPSFSNRLRKKLSRQIFSFFPRQAMALRTERFQSAMLPYQALFRFLVFKQWHDTFLEHRNS